MKPCCSAFVIASIRARIPQSIQMKKLLSLTKIAFECPVLVYFCLLAQLLHQASGTGISDFRNGRQGTQKGGAWHTEVGGRCVTQSKIDLFMLSEVSNLQKYIEIISIGSIR